MGICRGIFILSEGWALPVIEEAAASAGWTDLKSENEMQHRSRQATLSYCIHNLSTILCGSFMAACLLTGKSLPVVADTANDKGSEWQRRPRGRPRTSVVPIGTA